MNRNLFRKNAMLKVASPFELNRLVSIFSGREALALLPLLLTGPSAVLLENDLTDDMES